MYATEATFSSVAVVVAAAALAPNSMARLVADFPLCLLRQYGQNQHAVAISDRNTVLDMLAVSVRHLPSSQKKPAVLVQC